MLITDFRYSYFKRSRPRCLSSKAIIGELSINSGPPQDSRLFFENPRDLLSRRSSGCFDQLPVCHDSIPGHQVSYQRFWENRWIPDSLPQAHALVANLLTLNPPSSKLSGTCPLCLSTKATEGNHP